MSSNVDYTVLHAWMRSFVWASWSFSLLIMGVLITTIRPEVIGNELIEKCKDVGLVLVVHYARKTQP